MIARGHGVTNDNIVVSAPGRNGEQGSVHVYTYAESEARWSLLQTVTSELWSLGEKRGNSPSRVHEGFLGLVQAASRSDDYANYYLSLLTKEAAP